MADWKWTDVELARKLSDPTSIPGKALAELIAAGGGGGGGISELTIGLHRFAEAVPDPGTSVLVYFDGEMSDTSYTLRYWITDNVTGSTNGASKQTDGVTISVGEAPAGTTIVVLAFK